MASMFIRRAASPFAGAIRRAASPSAAAKRFCSSPPSPPSPTPSPPSSRLTDFELLVERIEELLANQEKIKTRHETCIKNFEKSSAGAFDAVKEARKITLTLEFALLGVALLTVFTNVPEKPSPTMVAAEGARKAADAANSTALAVNTTVEAAKLAAEAAKSTAEVVAAQNKTATVPAGARVDKN